MITEPTKQWDKKLDNGNKQNHETRKWIPELTKPWDKKLDNWANKTMKQETG